jgi:hypothetical protein
LETIQVSKQKKVDELFGLCETLKEKIIKSQEIKGLLAKAVEEGAVW